MTPHPPVPRRQARRVAWGAAVTVALLCVLLAIPAAAHAITLHVDIDRGNDAIGDGSIGRPYRHIWKGLGEAHYGDVVKVAPGVYEPLVGEMLPLYMPTGVTLQGDTTPLTAFEGLIGTVVQGNDTSRLIEIFGGDENTVVDGVYFRNNASPDVGGAIYIAGGALPGGGPVVRDCIFEDLDSPGGGAIRAEKGMAVRCEPTIDRCFFFRTSSSGPSAHGGAIDSRAASCSISDCWFVGCTANPTGRAGAVHVYIGGGSVIERCTFAGCVADSGGGAVVADGSDLQVTESTFLSNRGTYGGAIWAGNDVPPWDIDLYLEDCVFVGNSVSTGKGTAIRLDGVNGHVYGCTIFGNEDPDAGGLSTTGPGDHVLYNSILWGNGDDILAEGMTAVTPVSCCVEDLDTGPGVIHEDPRIYESAPNWRLLPDSPCVDGGSNAHATSADREGRDRPFDGNGDGTAVVDIGAYERAPVVDRAAGDDRYATAIAASAAHFDHADTIVLATGADYPDALCAASLAGAARSPVLLTAPAALPQGLATELERLETEKVYVVGGLRAVSEAVSDELRARGYAVERLAGADRYSTSRAVAEELSEVMATAFADTAIVARGDAFPDALAASPYAWRMWAPVLLTRPDELPAVTRSTMTNLGIAEAIVIGGDAAVSGPVFEEIDSLVGGDATRVAGADRYSTSAAFARWVQTSAPMGDVFREDFVGLATGSNFPDALCGGAVGGEQRGPLLLTRPDSLPSGARDYIEEYADRLVHVQAFGGRSVVSEAVLAQARGLIP